MKQDNLIIYVSSRNNYDMLEGEVLKNINREGFEFINLDDKSSEAEISKGKNICKKHNIVFLENKSRGVQMATQTLIDFVNKNRPNCKWIFCFQHDNYPISPDFFSKISSLITNDKLQDFGILGFNVLDHGNYTQNSLSEYKQGNYPLGMIGMDGWMDGCIHSYHCCYYIDIVVVFVLAMSWYNYHPFLPSLPKP